MRISDWSSDVCSSDLPSTHFLFFPCLPPPPDLEANRRRAAVANVKLRGRVLRYRTPSSWWTAGPLPVRLLPCGATMRSDARRVGKEGGATCRSRWVTKHQRKKTQQIKQIHKNN